MRRRRTLGRRGDQAQLSKATFLADLGAALLRELEGWPADAGPFGADSWDPHKSPIEWIAPHEREHAAMIAGLGAG